MLIARSLNVLPLVTLLAGFTASVTHSQILDLDSLKSVQRGLQEAKRDLMEPRLHREALADSLSKASDLHRANSASGELIETLIRLDTNCRALDMYSQQREQLESRAVTLRPLLRAAYDWEISRLFTELRESHDEGLLLQLTIFQEERKALGDEIVDSQMRYGEDMALSDADGPDEIHQKIELLEGMAERYDKKAQEIRSRLGTLEEESRLTRSISLSTRLSSRREKAAPTTPSGLLPQVANLQENTNPAAATVVQTFTVRRESTTRLRPPRSFTQDLEIEELKVQEREVAQIQAVVQERIAVFRQRLQELLAAGKE